MENILTPKSCEIIDIVKETDKEWTFRIASDVVPVSGFGPGYLDFTIRAVGKVTDEIFKLKPGDKISLRGAYGKGWPVEQFKNKNVIIVAGGTGVAPVRSLINKFYDEPNYVETLSLVFGFKNSEGILFKNDLDRWNEKFNTIYTLDNDTKEGWETGLVTVHLNKLPGFHLKEKCHVQ